MATSIDQILSGQYQQLTPRARQLLQLIIDAVEQDEPLYGVHFEGTQDQWRNETVRNLHDRLPRTIEELQDKAKRLGRPPQLTLFDLLHNFERQWSQFTRPQTMFFPEKL
jgi:hypothetical protein